MFASKVFGAGKAVIIFIRPCSGREHRVAELIQSGGDDYLMNETRRKSATGAVWRGICYMPSGIDTAEHTVAFAYPVIGDWG